MTLREQAAAAKTDREALKLVVDALRATSSLGMLELADELTIALREWNRASAEAYGVDSKRDLILQSADQLAEYRVDTKR